MFKFTLDYIWKKDTNYFQQIDNHISTFICNECKICNCFKFDIFYRAMKCNNCETIYRIK